LKKSNLKWLDIVALFRDHVLDDSAQLLEVRYYTSPVLGKMSDNNESPQRQRQYLQALRKTNPTGLTIIEGRIMASTPFQRLVSPIPEAPHLTKFKSMTSTKRKQMSISHLTSLLALGLIATTKWSYVATTRT
jgi:hypothetical protein